MKKVWILVTLLASMILVSTTVEPVCCRELNPAQKRLLAKRAAQADAYRKLAERILGLQIDSQTYVRDFVAESDQIKTEFDHFIKGARIVGQPRYYEDGSCEVDMELTLPEIVTALTEIAKHNAFGHKYKFTQMEQYVQEKVFRATGVGVARGEETTTLSASTISSPTKGIPGWENVTARGRFMAERAALVDAYRNLAEIIKGIRITGNTYVRDFVAESDYVQTQLDTFIKGARQVGKPRYLPDGEVEVTVEVTVQELVKELKTIRERLIQRGWNWRKDIFRTVQFEDIVAVLPQKVIRVTGNGVVPEKYRLGTTEAEEVSKKKVAPQRISEVITAVGMGVPPENVSGKEAQLMAIRAAELDARRQLAEKVYGVHISATTTVKDFVVQYDEVKADIETLVAEARISKPRFLSDGSVEVTAELSLEQLYKIIKREK